MSVTRSIRCRDDGRASCDELLVTKFALGGGEVGVQLAIGGKYVQFGSETGATVLGAIGAAFAPGVSFADDEAQVTPELPLKEPVAITATLRFEGKVWTFGAQDEVPVDKVCVRGEHLYLYGRPIGRALLVRPMLYDLIQDSGGCVESVVHETEVDCVLEFR